MKILFIIWMIFTLILAFSVIGMVLFLPKDTYQNAPAVRSTWMQLGIYLFNEIKNES